ncbi:hypothetical protein ACSSNL_02865 [Thalassobius sp. S69A]|uniref:hypothetical protein n=1 Tax=unclassified Thalassovita TaxID=2619711 RepID=UPI000C5C45C3|nr:hypothetical protein [Paracoccaceae bacterium]
MLQKMTMILIGQAERRLGVGLDYTRQIARTDFGLLRRYNRIFGFLDPNKKVPVQAFHAARLRGAMAADCGTCVEAEINLARAAGLDDGLIDQVLAGRGAQISPELAAVIALADAVTAQHEDDAGARETIRAAWGEAGLIELAYAMNGAALLPGIKRAMGYATTCNLDILRKTHTSSAAPKAS